MLWVFSLLGCFTLVIAFFLFFLYFLLLIALLINEVTDISADSYTPSSFLLSLTHLPSPSLISSALSIYFLISRIFLHFKNTSSAIYIYFLSSPPMHCILPFMMLHECLHENSSSFLFSLFLFFFFPLLLLLLVFSFSAEPRTGSRVLILLSYSQ